MSIEVWMVYLVASLGLSLTPGPNGLLALSHGAAYGARRSVYTILGGVFGFVLLMAVSMAGLGALLMASHQAFFIARLLGAVYLIYLGVKTWRSAPVHVDVRHLCDQRIHGRVYPVSKRRAVYPMAWPGQGRHMV